MRIKSTAKPVAATSNKCSHQQETTYRWMRTVASLTFDPSHSKAKGGTLVIEKISAKYCGGSARSSRGLSLDVASAYCSVQSCTMSRSEEELGSCMISVATHRSSLPCTIRLECRHDVFHALGDARDRRDGERVSFLTNSPHIARRVEGSKRREDLDSEICEGLRQQVDDAGPRILHDAHSKWNTSQTLRLDTPNTEEAQSEE